MEFHNLVRPAPQTPIDRTTLRQVMKPFEAVDALPPSLALLLETIEAIAAYWQITVETKIDSGPDGEILRIHQRSKSSHTNIRVEDKGYHYYQQACADRYDDLVPNTSGMAMWAVMGIRFRPPAEQAAWETETIRKLLERVRSLPFLDGVFILVRHNRHRGEQAAPPVNIAAEFSEQSAQEIADAIEEVEAMIEASKTVAAAGRDERLSRQLRTEFERAHPEFSSTSYAAAIHDASIARVLNKTPRS